MGGSRLEALNDAIDALISKAFIDDEALRFGGSGETGRGISRAGIRGDGSHLDAAKGHASKDLSQPGVIIKAGGQQHGGSVGDAVDGAADVWTVVVVEGGDEVLASFGLSQGLANIDEEVMNLLGIKAEEGGFEQVFIGAVDHDELQYGIWGEGDGRRG